MGGATRQAAQCLWGQHSPAIGPCRPAGPPLWVLAPQAQTRLPVSTALGSAQANNPHSGPLKAKCGLSFRLGGEGVCCPFCAGNECQAFRTCQGLPCPALYSVGWGSSPESAAPPEAVKAACSVWEEEEGTPGRAGLLRPPGLEPPLSERCPAENSKHSEKGKELFLSVCHSSSHWGPPLALLGGLRQLLPPLSTRAAAWLAVGF